MAHYALLDEDNVVTQVIPGKNEDEDGIDWEDAYSKVTGQVCVRTSINTIQGIHRLNGVPFRKNFAGIGYVYDKERDAFIPPKPENDWVLDEDKCWWVEPTN